MKRKEKRRRKEEREGKFFALLFELSTPPPCFCDYLLISAGIFFCSLVRFVNSLSLRVFRISLFGSELLFLKKKKKKEEGENGRNKELFIDSDDLLVLLLFSLSSSFLQTNRRRHSHPELREHLVQ